MRGSVPSFLVKGTTSCDGGGVGTFGEKEDFFAFFFLEKVGLVLDLGLTFLRTFVSPLLLLSLSIL